MLAVMGCGIGFAGVASSLVNVAFTSLSGALLTLGALALGLLSLKFLVYCVKELSARK
ncbi:hypothetical protein HHL18_14595 [Streptomyces sp. R301]|nr:hypothetical protein [Streptomyces sp. R301]